MSTTAAARVGRDVAPQPGEVAGLDRGTRDDEIAVSSRRVTVRSASMPPRSLQPLGVDDRGRRGTSTSAAERRFRTAQASAPCDQELGEARLVEQGHRIAHRPALGSRVLEPVLPALGVVDTRPRRPGGAYQFGRSQPAVSPMHGAGRDQPVVERRATRAAGGRVLPVGPVHRVEQAQASRSCGRADSVRLLWNGCRRRTSTSVRSTAGGRSRIHSARTLPAPPELWMPIELKPQATNRSRTSAVSPSR